MLPWFRIWILTCERLSWIPLRSWTRVTTIDIIAALTCTIWLSIVPFQSQTIIGILSQLTGKCLLFLEKWWSMLPHWALLLTFGLKEINHISAYVIILLRNNESPSSVNLCWRYAYFILIFLFVVEKSNIDTQHTQDHRAFEALLSEYLES